MDIKEYLFYSKKSITDLSKDLMVSRNYLSQIANRAVKPSKRLAKDIEQYTKGEVTAEELLSENPKDTHVCPTCGQKIRKKIGNA